MKLNYYFRVTSSARWLCGVATSASNPQALCHITPTVAPPLAGLPYTARPSYTRGARPHVRPLSCQAYPLQPHPSLGCPTTDSPPQPYMIVCLSILHVLCGAKINHMKGKSIT